MADVRSMLRNERATRRLNHPHLTYSTTGTLICTICHTQVKTEALWNKHLNSTLHATNLISSRDAPTKEDSNGVKPSKKRKADDESSDEDIRKRTKADQGTFVKGSSLETVEKDNKPQNDPAVSTRDDLPEVPPAQSRDPKPPANGIPSHTRPSVSQAPTIPSPAIDENEWAAFQRDIATPAPEPSALTVAADISAAPLSAAELAAQSREQASRQAKERLEAEVEGEKEDAARQLEEEFEEMAELEERVRRLRQKREELRMKEKQDESVAQEERPPDVYVEDGHGSDDGSSDVDDGEDGWGVWGR
ncbi:MAG: hypothetical protein L6R39_003696 [Caloplaca ligustica]|nr:MAG: hypothetical protein L6R39_003696 [Caloplaca ligustica]